LDGVNPGRVLVDDPLNPTAGFVVSPEAAYLSGDAGNGDFCTSLEAFLRDTDNLGLPMWHLIVVVSSDRWAERLSEVAGENGVAHDARRHYVCNTGDGHPALPPPPGAVLKRIDEDFLADHAYAKPEHIDRWVRHNWGSRAHFLSAGFGVATVCGTEVVAWSIADCASEGICEIGIHTAPAWRRKGMGAFAASGAIQCAFSIGMKTVGWHCHEENLASWRTAEKVGFVLERRYEEYRISEPVAAGDGDTPRP
jgi:RimJ/RimL family protein N-acetyltransferase